MGPLEGLTSNEIKQYIRFIGNRRLEQLGLDPIYDVKKNPFNLVGQHAERRRTYEFL